MVQPEKLKQLGEKIAEDFTSKGIAMNTSLEKLASQFGLNENQIHRVAETANVKVHLHMLKNASVQDAYITFDLADPTRLATQKTASTQADLSYFEDPTFSFFAKTAEKVEEVSKKDTPAINSFVESRQKIAEAQFAHSNALRYDWKLEDALTPIYSIVKQASLSGTDPAALEFLIKEASTAHEFIISQVEPFLEKDGINIQGNDLEKYAGKRVNTDNELVQKVLEFNKIANEAVEALNSYEEKAASLSKDHPMEKIAETSLQYLGRTLKGIWDFSKRHPVIATGGVMYGVGRNVGKNAKEVKTFNRALTQRLSPNAVKRTY